MVYLSEKEELKKKVKQLETQLKQQQNTANRKISDNTKQYSRRSFLKAAGAGAVGLGAAAMIGNTSAFRINSDQGLSYFNRSSNQSQFNVSPDGILDAKQIGTKKNPISSIHSQALSTDELSNVYDHVVRDSQDLANALDDSETNTNVSIHLPDVDGTALTPFDYKSDYQPWHLGGGTVIHGYPIGENKAATDNQIAYNGSLIDAGGNVLFDGTERMAWNFRRFGVTNYQHVVTCGKELGNGDKKGLMQSSFKDLSFWNDTTEPNDYALNLINWQRLRLDKIVCVNTPLVKGVGSHTSFQPGNSVWTDIHNTPRDDSIPAIYLHAKDTSVNYIDMQRPQVITGNGSQVAPAVKLEGKQGARPNSITISGGDLEGAWGKLVDCSWVARSTIDFDHNLAAKEPHITLDSNSQQNHIHSRRSGTVVHSEYPFNYITGWVADATGKWFGTVYHGDSTSVRRYIGGDTSIFYIDIDGSNYDIHNLNIEGTPKMSMARRDISNISGTSVGEVRNHNGGDGNAEGRYEWDGSQWVGIGIASGTTIIPS